MTWSRPWASMLASQSEVSRICAELDARWRRSARARCRTPPSRQSSGFVRDSRVTRYSRPGGTEVAQPIEQAPAWVRESLPSREEREAQHAEAQGLLEAIRGGD